jgi:cytochrome oxidase Cu insertion factor (SCO1/SenC/PrrC family)
MVAFSIRLVLLACVVTALVVAAGGLAGVPAAAALEVGERAPDFSLVSTTDEKISLSQFRGKKIVLLEFYGADFVPQ